MWGYFIGGPEAVAACGHRAVRGGEGGRAGEEASVPRTTIKRRAIN